MPSLQPTQQQSGLTATLSRGFARVLATVPHPPRSARIAWRVRRRGLRRLFRRSPSMTVEAAPRALDADPIAMVALAIDRLGPAAVRASCSGVQVRVAVPDDATAKIFRAALELTRTRRTTDRLIEVVVDAKPGQEVLRA